MKTQIVSLAMLAALSLAPTAFAGTAATPPSRPAVSAAHTPMTPQQTQALWRAAQTKLKAEHLYAGAINGERTGDSVDAIRLFQSRHRLPQTGELDHATRQALGV